MRWTLLVLAGCAVTDPAPVDPCDDPEGATAACVTPTRDADWYVEQSLAYFDTMDATVPLGTWPAYDELVARWEWPPWLKLTGYTRENIELTDAALRLYPSTVPVRDCRFFDAQPFGRCRITFRYEAHDNLPCPIYEEFTFDDEGEITFIEAWSDVDGLRPGAADDLWLERDDGGRLATRIPGLGAPGGGHDLDGGAMAAAVAADPDVADFVTRARDWAGTWAAELAASDGDAMWATGCGW